MRYSDPGPGGNLDPAVNSGMFNSETRLNRVYRDGTGRYRAVLTGDSFAANTARLGLTDAKGLPLCASVRPPKITWSVG